MLLNYGSMAVITARLWILADLISNNGAVIVCNLSYYLAN